MIRIYGRVLSEDDSSWRFAPCVSLEPAAGLCEPGRIDKQRYGLRRAARYGLDAVLVPPGAPVPFRSGWRAADDDEIDGPRE